MWCLIIPKGMGPIWTRHNNKLRAILWLRFHSRRDCSHKIITVLIFFFQVGEPIEFAFAYFLRQISNIWAEHLPLCVAVLESNTWLVPETQGAVPQGGYGHSSTYDAGSGSVYVHGGYKALPANKYGLVDDLYRYDVNTRTW